MSQMSIDTNVASLNAQRHLDTSKADQQQALERLSSGKRVNSASDDAAGLSIGERLTAQVRGMEQAERNANDGISYAQTAGGAMEEMSNLLQRVRELAVQSVNDTNTAQDRQALEAEVQQAVQEVDRIASTTQFNQQNVLDGSLEQLVFQVGPGRAQSIDARGIDVRGPSLGAEIADGQAVARKLDESGRAEGLGVEGPIRINGVTVELSGDEVSDAVNAISAQSGATGVAAFRADRATTPAFDVQASAGEDGEGGQGGGAFRINDTAISVEGGAGPDDVVDAVNRRSAETGVRAEQEGEQIRFVAESDFRMAPEPGQDSPIDFEGAGVELGDRGVRFERGLELATELGRPLRVGGDPEALQRLGIGEEQRVERSEQVVGPNGLSVESRQEASDAIRTVDFALGQINEARAQLGAMQNRIEASANNLQNMSESTQAARSRIMDADFAQETAEMTRAQVLQQAGTSVLSQANQAPQKVVGLLE